MFDYMKAIARLDLDFSQMQPSTIRQQIRDNKELDPLLEQLVNNKPMLSALSVLARDQAVQMDEIARGWWVSTEQWAEIQTELDEIRTATRQHLEEMRAQLRPRAGEGRAPSVGVAERLRIKYLDARSELKRRSDQLKKAEEELSLLEKAQPKLDEYVDSTHQRAGGSMSEWIPVDGARFIAMLKDKDGGWVRTRRLLKFKKDGSAENSDQVESDIANNKAWLLENQDRKGTKAYNEIERMTMELAMLDLKAKYPIANQFMLVNWMDRFVRTPQSIAKAAGGSAGARLVQMLNKFESIIRQSRVDIESEAFRWGERQDKARKLSGISDHGVFMDQAFKPAVYFIGVNPGLDEKAAIRKAVALAKSNLPDAQPGFEKAFSDMLRQTKVVAELVRELGEDNSVWVEDKRLGGELRRTIEKGWLTIPRHLDGGTVQSIIDDMVANGGWQLAYEEEETSDGGRVRKNYQSSTFAALDPSNANDEESRAEVFEALANTEELRGALQALFPDTVVDRWLKPFINKPGEEPFRWQGNAIPQLAVQQAWTASGGDVLQWIDNLSDMVEESKEAQKEDAEATHIQHFRLAMFRNLERLFTLEARMAFETSQVRNMFQSMGVKPHLMMDARMTDILPPEHLSVSEFDPKSVEIMVGQIAYNGAFGRDGKRMINAVAEQERALKSLSLKLDNLKGTTKKERELEAERLGFDLKEAQNAKKRLKDVTEFTGVMMEVFGVDNPVSPFHDLRAGLTIVGLMVGQAVDNPKTAAYNLLSIAMRPFAMRSMGPAAITATVRSYGEALLTVFGSVLEAFGIHMLSASQAAKEASEVEGTKFRNLPWSVVASDPGPRGQYQASLSDKWLIRPLRMLRWFQRKGGRAGFGTPKEFPRLAFIPGLGIMQYLAEVAARANTVGYTYLLERMVKNGVEYFNMNPDAYESAGFRFTDPKQLGLSKMDKGVLDYFHKRTVEYNMGTLEDMIRGAVERQAKGDRSITRDQVVQLTMMGSQELDGASSVNTTPAVLSSHPILRLTMPLVRWPLWMMHQVHSKLNTNEGQKSFKAMAKSLATLAMWNLPLGIAFSLAMDWYDEKLLGKKSNQRTIDNRAAIPFIGPVLALTSGEHSAMDDLLGMLQRSARAGNVYGLGSDLFAQMAGQIDPSTGQRGISLDQRVLVMSQLLTFQRALTNLMNLGTDATWSSVWRPFMMSMGGNGALHSMQVTNKLLGLDNDEARLVSRINSSQWIRSAAREVDLPVRTGGVAGQGATRMSTMTREMQMAALANDRVDFMNYYNRALNAAREAVAEDPRVRPGDREAEAEKRVLSSWRSRNPLNVLATRPTDAQLSQLLAAMSEDGRRDVTEALARYEAFTKMIAPSSGRSSSLLSPRRRSATQLRREVAGPLYR